MKLSERMRQSVADLWPRYLEQPFVREMAEGTLSAQRFRYYLLQDYVYLRDYIKIFAVSITKSDDYEIIRFLCDNMNATLEETFRVHVPYMKRMGIGDEEIAAVVPHIDSSSYSHYMICEAQAGSVLAGLAALLNCSWSYAYIGAQMTEQYPQAVQLENYGQWFRAYTCPSYLEANQSLIDMVDRLGEGISEEETEKLCRIFRKCSQYELRFWEMAYRMDGE